MSLGEGAASICLEKGEKPNALAKIRGIGYATEILKHNTSISADGECFEKSMGTIIFFIIKFFKSSWKTIVLLVFYGAITRQKLCK